MLELSIFGILALFMVGGAGAMVWNRQPLFGGFGFLLSMLALAGLFALLQNSFLFLAQIMVSVGAVMVLSLLVILAVNAKKEELPDEPHKLRWMGIAALLTLPFGLLMYRALTTVHDHFLDVKAGYGSLKSMGEVLFTDWVLAFELVSVLLLAAMVAAIVIARKEKRA